MAVELKKYSENDEILKQGDHGEWLAVVRSGSVEVEVESGEDKKVLAKLEAGSVFGEMAVLSDDDINSATVRALEDTELMQVSKADVDNLFKQASPDLKIIVKSLVKRMQKMLNSDEDEK
ncbi:MAG: cyclic nucleotide-binding domain-containing protein [Thiotrichales bacterium]|jgi:CRP-like cAMP-binding protein|nr:cyclic nucleotide-binding domain-containing protein [Thiotrichales bacterium]MBT3613385.1 cyclic nucleotide-binding domain-containing protein [Thiotrichales bacterium]MBT3752484.1 cyclic nucleotide-binding domain-containing protein [Thiotrichales bacterium]MBT3837443.1 cyclic nucleotide-binding domain-containing protein [Thiotrichales bacterium]MBT4260949.1 cyclic nucleotide-binding domain-containing protein [Thiotrichales bacterium]